MSPGSPSACPSSALAAAKPRWWPWRERSRAAEGSGEVVGSQLDRGAVRGAVGGAVPGVAVAREGRLGRDALFRHQALGGGEPVAIIGYSGVGIAIGLSAL